MDQASTSLVGRRLSKGKKGREIDDDEEGNEAGEPGQFARNDSRNSVRTNSFHGVVSDVEKQEFLLTLVTYGLF